MKHQSHYRSNPCFLKPCLRTEVDTIRKEDCTVVLGLERILTGEAVASILGGIIGYVLGTLQREYPKSSDDETAVNIR